MWPTPQDYNEAVQNPRSAFGDAELQECLPETNALGLPRPISGSFASVYHMRSATKHFAVRCFLRNVPDQTERYKRISECLAQANLPYTVPFDYLANGIKVNNVWYPVQKMQWVAGTPLIEWIQLNLQSQNAIELLLENFVALVQDLRQYGIAHGDLQHGNILVVGSQLKIVDYDGMYVGDLKAFASTELGHRHYQHPRRSSIHFGDYLDNFAAWSIYTSLYCLSKDTRLWTRLGAGDECLLLRQEDYVNPSDSIAFRYLEHHDSRVIREASRTLRALLQRSPEEIPPLGEAVGERDHLPDLDKPQTWFPSLSRTPGEILVEPDNVRLAYQTALAYAEGPPKIRIVEDDDEDEVGLPPWYRDPQAEAAAQQLPPEYYQLPVRPRKKAQPPAPPAPPPKKSSIWSGYRAPVIAITIPIALCALVSLIPANHFQQGPTTYSVKPLHPTGTDPNGWYEEARSEFRKKEYQKALASFRVALDKAGLADRKFCLYQIGRCYAALKDYPMAVANFESASNAFERDKIFVPMLDIERGWALLAQNKLSQADRAFETVLSRSFAYDLPERYSSSAKIGIHAVSLQMMESQIDEGLETYEASTRQLELDRKTVLSELTGVATRLDKKGEYDYAIKVWRRALEVVNLTLPVDRQHELLKRSILDNMAQNRTKAGDMVQAKALKEELEKLSEDEQAEQRRFQEEEEELRRLVNELPVRGQRVNPLQRMSTSAEAVQKQYDALVKRGYPQR